MKSLLLLTLSMTPLPAAALAASAREEVIHYNYNGRDATLTYTDLEQLPGSVQSALNAVANTALDLERARGRHVACEWSKITAGILRGWLHARGEDASVQVKYGPVSELMQATLPVSDEIQKRTRLGHTIGRLGGHCEPQS